MINLNVSAVDSTHEFSDFPSVAHLTAPSSSEATENQNEVVQ